MKLIDLLVATIVSDYNCPKCKIQIYEPSGEMGAIGAFSATSALLTPFHDMEINRIVAVSANLIRVYFYEEDFAKIKGYYPVPCRVGGKVYEILKETVPNEYFYIAEHTVEDVSTRAVKYADFWTDFDEPNLFFTREEAEAELKRRKEEEENENFEMQTEND